MSGDAPRRADLPEGTVTLLFTDIEGSTALLRRLRTRYPAVQDRHRTLLRDAFIRRDGCEVDTQGDAFMVAFRSASDALEAAVDAQRKLAEERWPDDAHVRVRMGIHTGEPSRGEEGYVGIDVVRAARICAAAHGGQIVVSRTTWDIVEPERADIEVRPLGHHRLKDIPEAELLYQLVSPGLEEQFPPLRTLGGPSLPSLHHRLVGRGRELEGVRRLLAQDARRLLTITGPGGAGKSRLALEVAAEAIHERPVILVGLSSIAHSELVPAAIARIVGVREAPGTTLVEGIAERLRGTGTLLVLDNLEHLPGAAAHVAQLIEQVDDLAVLVTSRAPLELSGERVVTLSPLPVDEAATLLTELADARGVHVAAADAPVVAAICRRLDGLPLAVELVVPRLRLLSPTALLAELDAGLALTSEGPVDVPDRQRTLRATIDWSYRLLSDAQRRLHMRIAVFAGGCAIDDARAIDDGSRFLADLEALVTGSLLRSDPGHDGRARLSMLETVREYAVARAAAEGILDEARRRHSGRFLDLAAAAEAELTGPAQRQWLDRLEREHDNLRAALDWAYETGRVERALAAVASLGRFWRAHGHVTEARSLLERGLASDAPVAHATRASALWAAARQAMAQTDHRAALDLLDEALALFQELGDDQSVVFALCEMSFALLEEHEHTRALDTAAKALTAARASGDARAISAALNAVATLAGEQGEHGRARELFAESLALRESLGDPLLVANSANNLGRAALLDGDLETAETALLKCLDLARRLGEAVHTAGALCCLGEVYLAANRSDRALPPLLEATALYSRLGDERRRAQCLQALGGVAAAGGRAADAARLWGAAESIRTALGDARSPEEEAVDRRFAPAVLADLGHEGLARARREGYDADTAALDSLLSGLGGAGAGE